MPSLLLCMIYSASNSPIAVVDEPSAAPLMIRSIRAKASSSSLFVRRDPLEKRVRLVLQRALAPVDAFEERAVELLARALPLLAELEDRAEVAGFDLFELMLYVLREFIHDYFKPFRGSCPSFVWR